jgi:hypothetical protein
MPKYAIIKQNTNVRDRQTIVLFKSSNKLRKNTLSRWKQDLMVYSSSSPKEFESNHVSFVKVYELPDSWRKPSVRMLDEIVYRKRESINNPNANDVLAGMVIDVGSEV